MSNADHDNHSKQCNPNNDAYCESQGDFMVQSIKRDEFRNRTALLDTNFLIESLRSKYSYDHERLKSMITSGCSLLITRTILSELERHCSEYFKNQQEILARWEEISEHLVVLNDRTREVVLEARHIETHYPDNLHIAVAKLARAAIISHDELLLTVARQEGLLAFHPSTFVEWILPESDFDSASVSPIPPTVNEFLREAEVLNV